jgi:hypothetical protein
MVDSRCQKSVNYVRRFLARESHTSEKIKDFFACGKNYGQALQALDRTGFYLQALQSKACK